MTEYKTFDDYVKTIFNIEPSELTHISSEEQKNKTVEITVDELINIWNELTVLKLEVDKSKWHYTKDGEYPNETQLVLLYRENPNGANIALTYWCKSYVDDKVIAWKEVIPPKGV